jgi:hypothetical protein
MLHGKIADLKTSVEAVFSADPWLDFEVTHYHSFNNGLLIITASRDFTYYHNLEIRFVGVKYFSGVFSWRSSPSESGILRAVCDDSTVRDDAEIAVKFLDDDDGNIVVLASSASISFDTVYYYDRTPLKENERIADWVATK